MSSLTLPSIEVMEKRLQDLDGKKVCIVGWKVMNDDNKKFSVNAGELHKFRNGYLLTHLQPNKPMNYYIKSEIGWACVYIIEKDKNELSSVPIEDCEIVLGVDLINLTIPTLDV